MNRSHVSQWKLHPSVSIHVLNSKWHVNVWKTAQHYHPAPKTICIGGISEHGAYQREHQRRWIIGAAHTRVAASREGKKEEWNAHPRYAQLRTRLMITHTSATHSLWRDLSFYCHLIGTFNKHGIFNWISWKAKTGKDRWSGVLRLLYNTGITHVLINMISKLYCKCPAAQLSQFQRHKLIQTA